MTDNGSKTRPARTLTVKNFSVIKEARLEFGKITVLIGPQASGKSLLCKLAHFLGQDSLRIAIDAVVNRWEFTSFESAIRKEFDKRFPRAGWGNESWSIKFASDRYEVSVSNEPHQQGSSDTTIVFSNDFRSAYDKRLQETLAEQARRGFLLGPALQSLAATRLRAIAGRAVWDSSTYIPVERSYIVDTAKVIASVASDSEPIVHQFALTYQNSLSADHPDSRIRKYIKGRLIMIDNEWIFAFDDERRLPLPYLSSGSKELLPILAVLDYYESQRKKSGNLPSAELYNEKLYCYDDFTIEEPEASVFPETQVDLAREIAALSNEADFVPHFTITTHSPYFLSAFSDLVKAGKVAEESSGQNTAVAKVIPAHFWIKPIDFAAYKIVDGVLESIYDEKTGQIDGDYLDNVSGKISDELGQLLEIQYGSK